MVRVKGTMQETETEDANKLKVQMPKNNALDQYCGVGLHGDTH